MRPVGAPQHAVRKLLHHAARKRHHVLVRSLLAVQGLGASHAQALGAAHLAPHVLVLAHELEEQRELFAVHALAHIRATHVVHHHGGGQAGEEVPQLGQVHRLKVDHHMPAQLGNAACNLHQLVLGREVHQALDEVEAHTAHARRVQGLQLFIRHAALDCCHATRLTAAGQAGIRHGAVVCAVAGGLHDHVAGKAQVVAQRKQLVLAGIAGRVLALGRVRKLRAGAEHMAVGVHRTCGQLKAGLGRAGVPVKPAGGFGEAFGLGEDLRSGEFAHSRAPWILAGSQVSRARRWLGGSHRQSAWLRL